MNKRGDIQDMLVFLVLLFILGIGMFILAFVVPEIADGLDAGGLNNSVEGAGAIDELHNFGTETIQRGFFFLFIGLVISTFISSFFVRTHPIFLFLYIFILVITVFLGIYLGNAYQTFIDTPIFADTLQSQGLMNIIFSHLITITIAVGVLSMVIVFAKFSSGLGGGGGRL